MRQALPIGPGKALIVGTAPIRRSFSCVTSFKAWINLASWKFLDSGLVRLRSPLREQLCSPAACFQGLAFLPCILKFLGLEARLLAHASLLCFESYILSRAVMLCYFSGVALGPPRIVVRVLQVFLPNRLFHPGVTVLLPRVFSRL